MDDLIRRKDALRMFPADMTNPLRHFTGIRAALENVPSVDAVPVVRCKDCRYRYTDTCPMLHTEWSWNEDDGSDPYDVENTTDNGFCHKGAK